VNDSNTMDMAPRFLSIQIMIGSIPITLGTTESVMVTSTEERETSPSKTPKVKVTKKSIKISKKASLKQKGDSSTKGNAASRASTNFTKE